MILKNVISAVSLVMITGLTLTTSVFGATKAADILKPQIANADVPTIKSVSTPAVVSETETEIPESISQSPSVGSAVSTPTGGLQTVAAVKQIVTPPPVTPIPSKAPANGGASVNPNPPPNASQCLVTLFGKKYDVKPLITGHPGGNVFVCNTDMTTVYQAQHGTNVSMMAKYLLADSAQSGSGSSSNGGSNNSSGSVGEKDDDSHESSEHEDNDLEDLEDHESSSLNNQDSRQAEADQKLSEAEREAAKTAAEK